MQRAALMALDIAAVSVLVFGLYFPRHRRRDLVVAYLGINVGVLAVASALTESAGGAGIGVGLGLALFGVLAIIRLRSTELDHHEVAYYFSSLALGILGALSSTPIWLTGAFMALILLVMFIGDHPRLFRTYDHQVIVLDTVFTDQVALTSHLEQLLGARVHAARVRRLDLVNDSSVVEVRFSHAGHGSRRTPAITGTGLEVQR